jgi:TPR repeat protein
MKRYITVISVFLLLCCDASVFSQEKQFADMELQEILDKAIEFCNGLNGVTIDRDKAQECFQYLANQQGYYAAIGKQALIEEKMVDCEKTLQYFKEIEDEVSIHKTFQNTCFMNFLIWNYDEESVQEHPCTPKDNAKAHFWAKMSAELGDVKGQYLYGLDFLFGTGTEVDQIEGLKWIKKSAEGGFKVAMMWLARLYLNGEFVQQNDKQALYWFQEAAKYGEGDAYYYIAIANCYGGNGIEQNMEEAKKWCREGIIQYDNIDCCWLLSEIMYNEQTNPERLYVLEKAAERDYKSAQAEMAKLHVFNSIPNADFQWGVETLKRLSSDGDPRAMAIYGGMLYYGLYIQPNQIEGIRLIQQSARAGDRMGKQNAKILNLMY